MNDAMARMAAIKELATQVQSCNECESIPENVFCNIIAAKSKSGIGYWSDAYQNFSAKLMIVGQDWGSELSVRTKAPTYEPYWEGKFPTWETLMKLLKDARFGTDGGEYSFTDIYLTNAILCARKGEKNSGPISDKYFNKCLPFLEEQINIIKPKIIATLGKQVFDVFARKYAFKYSNFYSVIATTDFVIPIGKGIILFTMSHTNPQGVRNRKVFGLHGCLEDDFKQLKASVDHC